jgi:hypothetical protein
MTILALPLASGVGTGVLVEVYSVDVNTAAVVKRWAFNNTTAGALTVTVAIYNGTGDLEMLSAVPLAAKPNGAYSPPELNGMTLSPGWKVKINAPAGVNFILSGIKITQ